MHLLSAEPGQPPQASASDCRVRESAATATCGCGRRDGCAVACPVRSSDANPCTLPCPIPNQIGAKHWRRGTLGRLRHGTTKSFRPADTAEPIRISILDYFAYELRAALAESFERLVDVVHGEHDAEIAQSVPRG